MVQIQVMEDNAKNCSGIFQTGVKASVPPLVSAEFTVQDQGVCSPRFLRSTMYTVPCTADMLKQSHLPLAINITPFARLPVQEVRMTHRQWLKVLYCNVLFLYI